MKTIDRDGYSTCTHETQVGGEGLPGPVLLEHFRLGGLIARAMTADEDIIGYWMKQPEKYPAELRGHRAILWGSYDQNKEKPGHVAYLMLSGGKIVRDWMPIDRTFHGYCPALLRPFS